MASDGLLPPSLSYINHSPGDMLNAPHGTINRSSGPGHHFAGATFNAPVNFGKKRYLADTVGILNSPSIEHQVRPQINYNAVILCISETRTVGLTKSMPLRQEHASGYLDTKGIRIGLLAIEPCSGSKGSLALANRHC